MTFTERFFRRPQTVWLRKALFQVHLWCGLGIGLYLVVVSVTGSVLVYRSELRQAFNPEPRIVSTDTGPRMSMDDLTAVVQRAYPTHSVEVWTDPDDPTHAVTMQLREEESRDQWLFDPYTGEDLGNALPLGWRATTWLLDLHDNLLGGETGRKVNGIGAILLTIVGLSGAVVWWPGVQRWRRSLGIDLRSGWRQMNWSVHSAVGFWTLAFILIWGATGIYLAFPEPFTATLNYIEPLNMETFEPRVGDSVLYWLTALHFGRFGGWSTKLLWAIVGVAPVLMFLTGGIMWWIRVVRPRTRSA
jgi:uncharacterized iron-regulated membrane protein